MVVDPKIVDEIMEKLATQATEIAQWESDCQHGTTGLFTPSHVTVPPFEYSDFNKTYMKQHITAQLQAGWTISEVIRFYQNDEDINPFQDEDAALHKMKLIADKVYARIGKPINYTA